MEEVVVSEVHHEAAAEVSEFWYCEEPEELDEDGDGDLVVPRRRRVVIEHARHGTPLSRVGEQVWRGALVMCDWMLEDSSRVRGRRVLELGAGAAVTAIVASQLGADVVATDLPDSVLALAKRNVRRNGCAFPVAKLDWASPPERRGGYDLVLAADVVYDDELTPLLFDALRALSPAKAVLSLELRYNFEAESLSVQAHAYRKFRELSDSYFRASRLDLPPQRLRNYDRSGGFFELWELLPASDER